MRVAKVLIGYSACPLTRAAFEAQGHEVWTNDLLPSRGDDQGRHLQMDVWDAIEMHDWDFGVFHPMCTYLTVSAAWAYKDPDYDRYPGVGYHQKVKPGTLVGWERRQARDEELENFRRLRALPFPYAIENPGLSFINTAICEPTQKIHPYQFNDDASKITGLWLSGVPKLRLGQRYPGRIVEWPRGSGKRVERWGNQTDSGQNTLSPGDDRWLLRSQTYPGIAAAMGAQWGSWLNWDL